MYIVYLCEEFPTDTFELSPHSAVYYTITEEFFRKIIF